MIKIIKNILAFLFKVYLVICTLVFMAGVVVALIGQYYLENQNLIIIGSVIAAGAVIVVLITAALTKADLSKIE